MKALIVDDERLARVELKRLLQPFKEINVFGEAVNAEDALEKITQFNPDLIFLDIQMPGKNGFDLCKDFRQHNTSTPVIMLTAFGELEDKVQGFDCGADDYLTKPFYMR